MNNKLILKYKVGGPWKPDMSNFLGKDEYWYDNFNATNYGGLVPGAGFLTAGLSALTNNTLAPDQWSAKDHFNRYFRGEWLRGKRNGTNTYLEDLYDDIRDKAFEDYMSKNYGKTDRNYTASSPFANVLQTIIPALKIFSTPLRNMYRKNQVNPKNPNEKEDWEYDSETGTWRNFGNYHSGKYINGEDKTSKSKSDSKKLKLNSKKPKLNTAISAIKHKFGGILYAAKGWKVENGELYLVNNDGVKYHVQKENDPHKNAYGKYIYKDRNGLWHSFGTFTPYDKMLLKKEGYMIDDNNDIVSISRNSSINTEGTKPVTPADTSKPVQSNTSTSFTPEQFLETLLGNDEYIKRFKLLLGIQGNPDETLTGVKPEPEVTKTEVTTPIAPTYESLRQANTAAFNNGIDSAYWRRNFRKSFNNALLSGDMYGMNPNGSQVFDINGMDVSEMIKTGALDPKKGLTRRGMRLLRKKQKEYNGNIFESAIAKAGSLPYLEMNDLEFDSLALDAISYGKAPYYNGNVPFMGVTPEESDEGDIVNIGTKTIPFYQELKRS